MNKTYCFFFKQILFIIYFISCIDYYKVYAGDLRKQETLNTLIGKLHSMYKDAFENEKTYITRRFFTKDGHSHFTLHVQKLREVDGVKTHNLRLEGKSKREGPIIYINNPVEARMPNPFLSIDQFKNIMFERVIKQKKEFDVNRNLLINANKQFQVLKHLENFTTEIFDVKKHVKQVFDVSHNTELTTKKTTDKLMKTILHTGSNKVNKKRKQKAYAKSTTGSTNILDELIKTVPHTVNKKRAHKVHVRPGTKSTRILHIMSTSKLPKIIADEEITTETIANEEITTETIVHEEITTETPVDKEVSTETASDEKNTTQTTVDHEIITTKTIADEKVNTETTTTEEINTETTTSEEMNTEKIVNNETATVMIAEKEIITEPVTTAEPATTTEATVRTTRTKQLRPFVFMGNR